MADYLQSKLAACPWCYSEIEWIVDASAGPQRYVEDCEVCCRPVDIRVTVDRDGDAWLELGRENE